MTFESRPKTEEQIFDHSDQSEERPARVRRHVDIDATPEEVFEALATEEGRERWLEESDREIYVESIDPPSRLTWWWAGQEEPATRVCFEIVALPSGARVIVTESAPRFPLPALVASMELVAA